MSAEDVHPAHSAMKDAPRPEEPMEILRDESTPEKRAYWRGLEKMAREVAKLPKWMREWAKQGAAYDGD